MNKCNEYKLKYFPREWGDRRDGWRVRNVDPFFAIMPYFMRKRLDSQVYFDATIPIDEVEDFIKKHKEEMPGLSLMHIVIASIVRVFSQRPKLNRFVMRKKIYARNYINISLMVKRSLTDEGEETLIKLYFLPTDTLYDVVRKVQKALEENQQEGQQNQTDKISKFLSALPPFSMRFLSSTLIWMDKMGILPRALEEISPWHTSFFLTNLGSIGTESVYHHLYEVGTCSMFMAMGQKSTQHITRRSGELQTFKTIRLKFTFDERIADGFYFASSIRSAFRISNNPEQLLTPPEQVIVDEGVGRKRVDV
jgi:DNA-binding HxlR family transcriptional regulator